MASFENAAAVEDYNVIIARSSTEELNHSGLYILGPITNTSVFSEFSSKKLLVIQFFIIDYAFHKFFNLVCFTGP